jgi:hypothetical protein
MKSASRTLAALVVAGGREHDLLGVASSGPRNTSAVGYVGIQTEASTFVAHCAC